MSLRDTFYMVLRADAENGVLIIEVQQRLLIPMSSGLIMREYNSTWEST